MTNLRTVNLPQERTFEIQLKNNQVIEFHFTPIGVANNQLWQMFATTEALNTLEQLINSSADVAETKSARKTAPEKKSR